MADLDVALRLRLINGLKAGAGEAKRDLAGIGEAARAAGKARGFEGLARDLDRTDAKARQLKRDLDRVAAASGRAGRVVDSSKLAAAAQARGMQTGGSSALGASLAGGIASRFGLAGIGAAGGGLAIVDQMRKAAKSSMDFERAMIEVGKATDTQGAELDAYGERVMKLARETGKTKEELSDMLASAGFAGRPKEELLAFTEYAAKATSAWRTNAEETGQALAELGNTYGANQRRIEEIGDAINTMADNSASRETDLLEFLRRAGASGKQAGIAAEQMLAFGAAMKEVGVRNEVAGTAMEALLNVMKLGAEFSKNAGDGLKGLGISSDKMRRSFVAKPVETMIDLLDRLNKVADPLKRAEIMTNLFGKEYQDDMAKLLNALPQINKHLALMSDKAAIAKSGVRFQFAQNLDKDVQKIARATQAIDVLYKRIGDPIKTQVGDIAEQINKAVDRIENSDSPVQRLLKRFQVQDEAAKQKAPGGPQPNYNLIDRYATKLHGVYDPEMARAAAANDLLIAEAARVASVERVAQLEKEIAETRAKIAGRGGTERQAEAAVQNKRAELKLAKQAAAEAAQAETQARDAAAALDKKPLRMGVHPLAPIQGKPGAITPGIKSWQDQYPIDINGRTPMTGRVPLPPARPGSLPRGINGIEDVLGPKDLSGSAEQTMSTYEQGLKSGLQRTEAEVKAAVARMQASLSFTATPTITPRISAPSGGGAAPASAPAAPAGSGAGRTAALRQRPGGNVRIGTVNVHGVRDMASLERGIQREADRAARSARNDALHDTGHDFA